MKRAAPGLPIWLAAAVSSAVAVPATALAGQTVEVEGAAAIVGGDMAMARDKAIDDAKRKAVEQVAGTRVSAETITENFQLVQDRIYARASGFVRNFEIKSQFKDEGTYFVKIRAEVDADAIADNLSQLFTVKPRVIILIAEQNVGAGNYAYWWGVRGFSSEMDIMQTTLIARWQPKGFKFVDPGALSGEIRVKKGMRRPELSNNDVLTLSRGADADVAIVGKVAVSDAGPVMEGVKMRSFHAVGTLRVLDVDTGHILAVADDTGVGAHIDGNQGGRLAIKALATKIGDKLEKAILGKWTAEAAGAKEVELVVKGRLKARDIDALRQALQSQVRGVERVDLRRRKKKKAYLVVQMRGTAMDLGRALEDADLGPLDIEVDSVTKNKVIVEASKNKP